MRHLSFEQVIELLKKVLSPLWDNTSYPDIWERDSDEWNFIFGKVIIPIRELALEIARGGSGYGSMKFSKLLGLYVQYALMDNVRRTLGVCDTYYFSRPQIEPLTQLKQRIDTLKGE